MTKLGQHEYDESIGEMKDADELVNRTLFLDGLPNVQRLNSIGVGENVEQILKADLALEDLRTGIAYCEDVRDFVSRDQTLLGLMVPAVAAACFTWRSVSALHRQTYIGPILARGGTPPSTGW